MIKPTIIVIGRADVINLGLIRSVGRLGYKIVVIHLVSSYSVKFKPLDYYSKFVSSFYFSKTEDMPNLLLDKCKEKGNKPVLFPLDDLSLYLIDKSHLILKDYFLYSNVANQECGIIRLMDKSVQKSMAIKAGLNVAKGWIISIVDGKYVVPNDIEYPCFIKNIISYTGDKDSQQVCFEKKELLVLLQKNPNASSPLLAEEYLPVDEELGFMGITDGNNSIVPVMVEKTEIGKVTTNGVTMAGKISILKEDDQIVMLIKKFLSSLNYTGISNLDFIYSKGKLYFIEVNFRYAAWGYGVSRMGINFPQLFIEAISGNNIHMNITNMEGSCHFFNEKIGAINVIEKSLKISKYRNLKNTSDCCIVYCKDDPHPYIAFVIIYFLKLIKSRLKLYCHL